MSTDRECARGDRKSRPNRTETQPASVASTRRASEILATRMARNMKRSRRNVNRSRVCARRSEVPAEPHRDAAGERREHQEGERDPGDAHGAQYETKPAECQQIESVRAEIGSPGRTAPRRSRRASRAPGGRARSWRRAWRAI